MTESNEDPKTDRRRTFNFVLAGLCVALLATFAFLPRIHVNQNKHVGKSAPGFELPVIYGADGQKSLSLASLKGHAVLLDFWATWCPPCRAEMPTINRLAKRLKSRGIRVVGVNVNDRPASARAFAKSLDLVYPIVADVRGQAGSAFGVENLPTIIVLDKKGNVFAVRTGLTDEGTLENLLIQANR